jgi:hypothetical protein
MPLTFLLDEHLRGALWHAVQQHNAGGVEPLHVVRVGGPPDLPLGSLDSDILLWAEREGRILISRDRKTLPGHLAQHLRNGHHSPGIWIIRRQSTIANVVSFLTLAAYASDPMDWQDQVVVIP